MFSFFISITLFIGIQEVIAETITPSEKEKSTKTTTKTSDKKIPPSEKKPTSTQSESSEKSEDKKDEPKLTKTAQLSKANGLCETRMGELCQSSLCPTYCESKYGNWHHSGDMMQKECEARCKTDLCMVKAAPDSFDTPLDIQLREQLKVCMKEIPDQKDPEGEDHKWITFRADAYGNLEKSIKDKHDSIEKEQLEKEKKKKEEDDKKAEEEEQAYARCWMSKKKTDEDTCNMDNTPENGIQKVKTKENNPGVTADLLQKHIIQGVVEHGKKAHSTDIIPLE
ncbi:MAG: hypothetical protein K2X98_06385 [Alphaproteobacteria bacterium]|nr:hypothetical protein [Alphaproteobacteria bacterium]MBX9977852.1 hypothetical protein [Alphaproteobacteria bacterium]